jgi:NTE family protein
LASTESRSQASAEQVAAGDLAVVLTGGGARAAYQVGVLRRIARHLPETRFDIVTGVSAGAINAAFLASRSPRFSETIEDLVALWSGLRIQDVFRTDLRSLAAHLARWLVRLASGGARTVETRGLVDTRPLATLLERALPRRPSGEIAGIAENVASCSPKAVALTTLDYRTGQTVVWVQGCGIRGWESPLRRSVEAPLGVEHVMASAALPIFFPAIRLGGSWYGDGGIRLVAPLSPALHLGAQRILAISTSHRRSFAEADEPGCIDYPPPAQILGLLTNSVFLDVIDQDARRLERSNRFLERLPPEQREGFRIVDLLVLRPSRDLGKLVEYEARLPRSFRYLSRGWGTRETSSADLLSLLMFEPGYLQRLIEIGESDADARLDEITAIVRQRSPREPNAAAGAESVPFATRARDEPRPSEPVLDPLRFRQAPAPSHRRDRRPLPRDPG